MTSRSHAGPACPGLSRHDFAVSRPCLHPGRPACQGQNGTDAGAAVSARGQAAQAGLRTGICLLAKEGEPTAGPRSTSFLVQDGPPPGPGRLYFRSRAVFLQAGAAFLQLLDLLHPWPERPSSSSRTGFLRCRSGLPPAPELATSVAGAAFLQLQDRLPPWPGRPSSSSRTGFLRGRSGLPPAPELASSVAGTAFLLLQNWLPPWPGRPSSSSRTGYLRGQGGLPPALGQASSVAEAINT
jgi:hypothetical protein